MQILSLVTLLVDDYDRAIAHYCGALGFALREDTDLGGGKRWVRVAPPGDGTTDLLLAVATTDAQRARIGDQTGGRVGFFLQTDDFWRDHARMSAAGVEFLESPRKVKLRHRGRLPRCLRQPLGPAATEGMTA